MLLTVDRIEDQTDHIRSIWLVGDDLPGFTPGAHLKFDCGEAGQRAYSLISWTGREPSPATYEIAVQREDNGTGGSKFMHGLKVGDTIEATGPKNDFPLAPSDALLIAGGIGITPMISMAAHAKASGRDYAFHYAARSADVMAFGDRLAEAHGAALTRHYDDVEMMDLKGVIANGLGAHLHICGPKGMIEAAREMALAAGYAADHIHFELFNNTPAAGEDAPFEVEIADTGDVYTIPPGKSIIEVLEAAGHDLVYDCLRGDCGICQTDVVSGEPDHRDVVLSDAERAEGKVMQICVGRAKSARLVLDI